MGLICHEHRSEEIHGLGIGGIFSKKQKPSECDYSGHKIRNLVLYSLS